ncbi:MAG: hypothetical protein A2Z04_08785, partial [Chloroflexi bacterium RBG_16_57_9]
VIGQGRLAATTDYAICREADVILIAVDTPVDPATHRPQYTALRGAVSALGQYLQPGTLVIVESTVAPRTMLDVVAPLLESTSGLSATQEVYLVHCPERVMPGRLLANLKNVSRVVGGMTPAAAEMAVILYRHVVQAELDVTDCLTAEIVKTAENAYRDVQIAFANEVALLCETVGADVYSVRTLLNKSPGRHMLMPGAGVGGHCLPKDSWLLVSTAGDGFQPRLIPTARNINDSMPLHMVDLVVEGLHEAGCQIAGAKVAVFGYAYLENSDDTRNSPSEVLIKRLQELGADVRVHDPFVREHDRRLDEVVQGADCVVIMVAHDAYQQADLSEWYSLLKTPVLIDGRHVIAPTSARASGFVYRGIGQG